MLSRAFRASATRTALALVVACGCAPAPTGPQAERLILISVDTLRADHLGCYGYERPTSPNLDRLAAQGTLFEQASSTASWTVPAHMSMLTGQYARTHGIDGWQKAPAGTETIASVLQERGFATAAYVNVVLLNEQRGFERGFDEYHIVPQAESPVGATNQVLQAAIPWIEQHAGQPFFLFLHFYDVHSDYDPLPAYREAFVREYDGHVTGETHQLRAYRKDRQREPWSEADARHLIDLYDAGIRQFDDQIQPLLDFLERSGLAARTVVALTSDHGEEFLERGDVLHGRTLHQELVHVPLLLRGPGVPVGMRVPGNASLVDLMPTLLGLLGAPVPEACEGIDLARVWRAGADLQGRVVFAEADKWLAQEPGNIRRAVRRGRFKLLYDHASGARQVFDLGSDPRELRDLGGEQQALTKALWLELETFLQGERDVEEVELSEIELRELEALGYF
ncbi:MAG TPA: sulfatase [Planctomycetota bacterium]